MTIPQRIDEYLLDRFETVATWIQSLTGMDCLDAGRMVCITSAAVQIVYAIVNRFWFLIGFAGMTLLGEIFLEPGLLEQIRAEVMRGFRNRRRYAHATARRLGWAVMLFIPLVYIGPTLGVSLWQCFVAACFLNQCGNYMGCCDPKPPQQGKVREWLEQLQSLRMPQPVTQGESGS